ncbi:MAG: glycosyltransferase family 2 protein [Ramlibacter sp.]
MIDSCADIVGIQPDHAPKCASEGKRVAILLCTYNGEQHLQAQLDSIAAQSHTDWALWISDDGSTDGTLALIQAFVERHPPLRVNVVHGPRQGFAANYMSLVHNDAIQADYFAFSDQDDIWLPQRLRASVERLHACGDKPALYCGRTQYIDARALVIGESRPPPAACTFAHALAQNVCGGNTMLINPAARALMRQVPPAIVVAHDWLAYLLVTGVGGTVVFDAAMHVQYRQHAGNAMGENRSVAARWHRLKRLYLGDLRRWTDLNLAALAHVQGGLTPHSARTLAAFKAARSGPPWARWRHLRASGVQREGHAARLAYSVALACNLV